MDTTAHSDGPNLAMVLAVLAPDVALMLLAAGYTAGQADAHGQHDTTDPALASLLARVRALARDSTPSPRRAPHENSRNLTLATVCSREGLTLPRPAADETADDVAQLVLRAYTRPRDHQPYWTVTNTGGRCYRFWPIGTSYVIERRSNGVWQGVPVAQVPRVLHKLRQALAEAPSFEPSAVHSAS